MDDLERQILNVLDAPCGCVYHNRTALNDNTPCDPPLKVRQCSRCLPHGIAAALRAVEYKAIAYQRDQNACHFNAFRKPKIEREEILAAGLAALKGGNDG